MLKHILLVLAMTISVLGLAPNKESTLRFLYDLPVCRDDSLAHQDDGYLNRCGQYHVHNGGSLVRVVKCLEYKPGYAYIVLESTHSYNTAVNVRPILGVAEVTYPKIYSENPTLLLINFDTVAIVDEGFHGYIDTSDITLVQLNARYWGLTVRTRQNSMSTTHVYKCSSEWPVVWRNISESDILCSTVPDNPWYLLKVVMQVSSGNRVCRTYRYDGVNHYVPMSQKDL